MFSHLKIATRLYITGLMIVAATLALSTVGYVMVSRLAASAHQLHQRGLTGSKLLSDANNAVWELRFGIANYTLANVDGRRKILDGRSALLDKADAHLLKYSNLELNAEQSALLKELRDVLSQYRTATPQWFSLIDAEKLQEAAAYRAKVTNALGGAMVKNINLLIEKQVALNEGLVKEAQGASELAHVLLLSIGGASLLVVLVSMFLTFRAITQPLHQLQSTIEGVERTCDFTRRVPVGRQDEIGQTALSFNQLMHTLQQAFGEMRQCIEQVAKAIQILTTSSTQVASGSTRQSETTIAIAASMEQMAVSIESVSENAGQALALSSNSGKLSGQGRDIIERTKREVMAIADSMRQASQVIEQLGQQSNQISSVVQVIKDVADQTNLLALNAAIEAARAGEQGRGFAVVADEVRKLAERTSQSTAEITQMISGIQASSQLAVNSMTNAVVQVDGGVVLAQQAGDAIHKISDHTGDVAGMVKEIAGALAEQSSASNSVSSHVDGLAQMTESNTEATNQIANAARDLERLAGVLNTVASRFRV